MIQHESNAVLVLHKGKVVWEWYADGYAEDSQFQVFSVTKSFASTAIGLLIDEGKIPSVQEPAYTYIPQWSEGKHRDISIELLLEQHSGLKDRYTMFFHDDQLLATYKQRRLS